VCQLKPGKAKIHVSGFKARQDIWLDLTSPRLHPFPLYPSPYLSTASARSDREPLSISGAEERRHFAAVRDALGLDPTSGEGVESEGGEAGMARRKRMSSLNSAGFRVPGSKKVPMPALVASCNGLPPAGLRAAKLVLHRALESSLRAPLGEDADSPGVSLPAAAGVVGRSSGAAVGFTVKSRAYRVPSPSNGGAAPMMMGFGGGGDGSRSGWLSSATALTSSAVGLFGGNVGEASCAAAEAQLRVQG